MGVGVGAQLLVSHITILHLGAIIIVVLQSWTSLVCPLTTWGMQLRGKAGGETYEGAFIQQLVYYEAPG